MKITNNYQLNKSESHHEESQEIDSKDAKTASIAYSALIALLFFTLARKIYLPFLIACKLGLMKGKRLLNTSVAKTLK